MTRRIAITLIPGALFAAEIPKHPKAGRLPPARGEFVRFADSVTENVVVRLTQPLHESILPAPDNRFVSSREGFLIFASDRNGGLAPFQANLRTGVITQLAHTRALQSRSLALNSRERELWFIDDKVLGAADLQKLKVRTILEGADDFHINGHSDTTVVLSEGKLKLLNGHRASVLAEGVSSRALVSPMGSACVFCRIGSDTEFWLAPFNGEKPRLLAKGDVSYPYWRPDGAALLFLRNVGRRSYVASELREVALDGSPERTVAETSQYDAFAPNGDGSVFVGASRSKAQPDVMILLRSVQREMVLCEHRARNPRSVSPAFSPNSQRVYFQSDHEGKSAIYSVNVERLVEATEDT